MCKLLILGQHSNSFKRHLTKKQKADQLIEFRKLNQSFGGEYISRNGISLDSEYDAAVIVEYPDEDKANQFVKAMRASKYVSKCKIYKLTSLKTLEQNYIDVGKVLNFRNNDNL